VKVDPPDLSKTLAEREGWSDSARRRWAVLCGRLEGDFDVEELRYVEISPQPALMALKRGGGHETEPLRSSLQPAVDALARLVVRLEKTSGTERRRRVVRRIIGGALLGVAGTLVGLTGFLLVQQWGAEGGPPGSPNSGPERHASITQSTHDYGRCLQGILERTRAQVTLVVHSVDTAARTLTINVFLCAPERQLLRLVAEPYTKPKRRVPVLMLGSRGWEFRAGYAQMPVKVNYAVFTPSSAEFDDLSGKATTLRALAGGVSENVDPEVSLGKFVIPIAEAPGRYPFDWYASRGDFTVDFGFSNVSFPYGDGRSDISLPADVTILRDPGLGPFELIRSVEPPFPKEAGVTIDLRLERSATARLYVVAVASIPLVLAALLLILFFAPGRSGSRKTGPAEFVGVAAASLLAVLPIRSVLVPSDVSGLTIIDYLLGFEMAVLAGVACLAAFITTR
jgi:hypothetical protein